MRIGERRTIRNQAHALLCELGPDPDAVATALGSHHVHGRRRDVQGCALAVYLNAVMGSDARIKSVKVTNWAVHIDCGGGRRPIEVRFPRSIHGFVTSFDAGRYPSLTPVERLPVQGHL